MFAVGSHVSSREAAQVQLQYARLEDQVRQELRAGRPVSAAPLKTSMMILEVLFGVDEE